MDQDTFWRLPSDGWRRTRLPPPDLVAVEGDVDLGRRVLAGMAFMT